MSGNIFISREIIRIMHTRSIGTRENLKLMMKNIKRFIFNIKRANKVRYNFIILRETINLVDNDASIRVKHAAS